MKKVKNARKVSILIAELNLPVLGKYWFKMTELPNA